MNKIECPGCQNKKKISLYIVSKLASLRIPVKKGKPNPAFELLRENPITKEKELDDVAMRYSSADKSTRLMIHRDDMEIMLDCPKCGKAYTIAEDIELVCKNIA